MGDRTLRRTGPMTTNATLEDVHLNIRCIDGQPLDAKSVRGSCGVAFEFANNEVWESGIAEAEPGSERAQIL